MAIRSARKDPKYTAEQLEVGYVQYEEQLQGQNRLKKTHYGNSQFRQAIPNMPNLQHLVMAISNYRKPASNYFTKTFEPGLHKPFTDATNGHAPGLPQLRAFYLAAFQHGLKLRSFVCEGISRQFLNSSKEDLDKLADVLSEATDIVLRLNTVIGHRRPVAQWGEHRRDLKNRRIADLLRQIEHLQSLELHLEGGARVLGWELQNVVGTSTWSSLTRISLGQLNTTEEDLVHLIERHAMTLRNLHLRSIRFRLGRWITALPRMQICLKHKIDVVIEGHLTSQHPLHAFCFGSTGSADPSHSSSQCYTERRQRVATWFKNGGECPLIGLGCLA